MKVKQAPFHRAISHLEQLASGCEFQHEINLPIVPEPSIQAENVRVTEVHLNLDLALEIVFTAVPAELVLMEDLHREEMLSEVLLLRLL